MHDELVKQLRDNAEFLAKASSGRLSNSFADTMCQAADAIEELQKLTDAQLDIIKQYQAYLNKLLWIPVTERLPEPFENILIANKRGKHYDIDKGWWNGTFFDRCVKGGYHNVTHWMPLPEPPKEKT